MPRIHATLKKILLAISILLIFAFFYLLIFINFYFKNAIKSAGEGRIIFYNRIPKTGSTTFTNAVAYDLCAQNGFHVAHLNLTKNRFQMGKIDQAQLVRNLTGWTRMHPLFLHGHIAFVNFQSFGLPRPIWINLLREPFDRFVSHYYFLRFGDNFRVGLKRSKAGNNETFDECFLRGAKECHPNASWLQIPYFCGTAHFCSEPGNPMALEMAKRNLIGEYLLVGVMERMEQMIEMLEQMLPEFFRGAISHFRSLDEKRAHLRHTIRKVEPSEEVRRKFTANPVFQMEKEFYDFALAEFDSAWRRTTLASKNAGNGGGELLEGRRQFHFEKIRP